MQTDWPDIIKNTILESIKVKQQFLDTDLNLIERASQQLLSTLKNNGKILLCGNGGSAADSQHIAAELVVRLRGNNDRPAMAAMALTVDTSILTASSNDYGFEQVFSRQIEALGQSNDTLIAISTSGNSPNIIEAVNMAHEIGLYVIGFLGGAGGNLKDLVDLPIIAPSKDTARIQEIHILMGHIICDILEKEMFS
jgi:D-sedoheptulose 7-phosphate isomerase